MVLLFLFLKASLPVDTSGASSSFWKQEAQLGRRESNSEMLLRELMQPGLNPKEHLNRQSRMSDPWSPSLDKNISESFDVHHMAQMNILSLWLQNQHAPPWVPSHPYGSKNAPQLWPLVLPPTLFSHLLRLLSSSLYLWPDILTNQRSMFEEVGREKV